MADQTADFVRNITLLQEELSAIKATAATSGNVAFILTCSFLVFFMTPGLGFFYSGMTQSKNALSLILLCFMAMSIVMLQWLCFGFSLAYSDDSNPFIGNGKFLGLKNVNYDPISSYSPDLPGIVWCLYQMMFACITPALIIGSSAERVRLLPTLVFVLIWTTVVYDPVAYWTWGANGWLRQWGGLDFAGGTPVHVTSGFAGLAFALVLGKRKEFGSKNYRPSSIANVLLGTAMLWFGWFGFNGGSGAAADGRAGIASMNTTISAATAGLIWVILDFRHHKKLSALGFCSGAVAGLVGVTPAAGFIDVGSAVAIGAICALACNYAITFKLKLGYDDALDAFGIHGVGGYIGCLLTGIFADNTVFPGGSGWFNRNWKQLYIQFCGATAGAAWSFTVTALVLLTMDKIPFLSLHVHPDNEHQGLDAAEVGELAYDFTDHIESVSMAAYLNTVHRIGEKTDVTIVN